MDAREISQLKKEMADKGTTALIGELITTISELNVRHNHFSRLPDAVGATTVALVLQAAETIDLPVQDLEKLLTALGNVFMSSLQV